MSFVDEILGCENAAEKIKLALDRSRTHDSLIVQHRCMGISLGGRPKLREGSDAYVERIDKQMASPGASINKGVRGVSDQIDLPLGKLIRGVPDRLKQGLQSRVVHESLKVTCDLFVSGFGIRGDSENPGRVLFEFFETQHLVFEYQILIFVAIPDRGSIHLAEMSDLGQLEASGRYKEAVDLLKQSPTYDAVYFYNLGVLHGKLGQAGPAVAYLEKANSLRPHDPEVQRNLALARDALRNALAGMNSETGLDSASTSLERFSDRIQGDEILGVTGLVTLIVSLLWIRAYLKTRNLTKTFLKPSGWFGFLALVLVFAFYGLYRTGNSSPAAILIGKELLRSGPGLSFPEITPIESGVKVRLVGSPASANENELWQKVRYKNDQTAWVPLSSLLPL